MFDRQQFLNNAVLGIVAQGGPAISGKACRYRGPNNTKCAIGHNISDNAYKPSFEGLAPSLGKFSSLTQERIAKACGCTNDDDLEFVQQLQRLHDNTAIDHYKKYFMSLFLKRVRAFAERRGLKMPEVNMT